MFLAEVIETKMAFKPSQKDDQGNPLPLGSIQIRLASADSNLGQVRNIYARPAVFNKRIPLIGESVLCFFGPTNDWSTASNKGQGAFYLCPTNATDDVVVHNFPKLWKRKSGDGNSSSAEQLSDKAETGRTFPKSPKKVDSLQPFEGDDLYESRNGSSIRFGSTLQGGDQSIYDKKPTWEGSGNFDPLMIIRVKKPTGGNVQPPPANGQPQQNNNKYSVEDLTEDDSSIYITSNQSLSKLKAGFDKNQEAKQIGNWAQGSQIVIDSDRVVINAKKNLLLLIGKEKTIVTGKQVILQSDKYKVDLDDLMDFLKKWLGFDTDLVSAKAQFSTASGPTGVATSMSSYIQLQSSDFNKFKQP